MQATEVDVKPSVYEMSFRNLPVTIIKPSKGWMPINLHELWEFKDLLYFFTWRDIKLRYKQTVLGFAWAIIQPFFAMLIFTLFFGSLAKLPSDGVPYPIFAYAALLPWTMFSESIARSTSTMVMNSNIIKKVYFPRMALPISSVLSPIVDFAIAFVILILMMAYFGVMPTINVIWMPAFLLLAIVTSLGVGLWTSALNARYRDIQYVVPFVIQIWMFASPVVYASSMIPVQYQFLYGLNPMAGVIEGFRWSLLSTNAPGMIIIASVVVSLALLVSGAFYFRRMEKTFADEV
ncbi:ABC transporter permease protein [Methanocella paludicola SANAE]|uniref:ABC transporter permease protein n=1 Tax=Methanocella paludicola (strain DSM 17711 / JCM 13418 / NBRC 101707 / SANAE) TaxID=304371 RepID=D1YZY6_METPS|nr:ABC transporter permease protein [Methanocella paludicola SANAE]